MTDSEAVGPPPRRALKCPNGHTRWRVRDEGFYCPSCSGGAYDADGHFEELWDQRTRTYLSHAAFVERWGPDPGE